MTTMELPKIKVPDACKDCGDTKNGSHTCEDTPHRDTPHMWNCWGCKDGIHAEMLCAFKVARLRVDNGGKCLCCNSIDFAPQSVMCKACDTRGRKHPEVMNYEPCDAGCGRVGTFSLTCRFCLDKEGCIGCGKEGYTGDFCSRECMRGE